MRPVSLCQMFFSFTSAAEAALKLLLQAAHGYSQAILALEKNILY